jgi:hypothetical protein
VTLTQPERSQPDLAKRPHGEAEKDRSLLLHEAWSAEMMLKECGGGSLEARTCLDDDSHGLLQRFEYGGLLILRR